MTKLAKTFVVTGIMRGSKKLHATLVAELQARVAQLEPDATRWLRLKHAAGIKKPRVSVLEFYAATAGLLSPDEFDAAIDDLDLPDYPQPTESKS